jgi:hypothetical protein
MQVSYATPVNLIEAEFNWPWWPVGGAVIFVVLLIILLAHVW